MRTLDDYTFKLLMKHRDYNRQGIIIPRLQSLIKQRLRASTADREKMHTSRFSKAVENMRIENKLTRKF